jgi:hypothetical protein
VPVCLAVRMIITTVDIIFSVTYCSELHVPVSFYYLCTFLPSKDVDVQ